jgi:predicted dehydrogenase
MIAAAERHAKALQIGTQRRHSTTFQMAIDKIHTSPLGRILFSDVNTYRGDWAMQSTDPKEDSKINWRLSREKSGGIAYEQGAHTIDLNLWILGAEPLEVSGMMGVNNPALRSRTSPDFASFQVLFDGGAVSNYGGCVYNYGATSADRYFGTHGSVSLTQERLEIEFGAPRGFELAEPNPAPIGLDLPPRDGTDRQMAHFAKVMQGLAEPTPDGHDGRRVIMILRAAEAAARERCAVRCSEAA